EIVALEEAHVIGGDHRGIVSLRQLDRRVQVPLLAGTTGALQLEEKVGAEQPPPELQLALCPRLVAGQQGAADVALATARERDQTDVILDDPIAPDYRHPAVLALAISPAKQAAEAAEAIQVATQQHQSAVPLGSR